MQASATPDGHAVQISWNAAAGTDLETTARLEEAATWAPITLAPELVNERWQLTLLASNATAFFRLKQ
jgi:hypothetical protein